MCAWMSSAISNAFGKISMSTISTDITFEDVFYHYTDETTKIMSGPLKILWSCKEHYSDYPRQWRVQSIFFWMGELIEFSKMRNWRAFFPHAPKNFPKCPNEFFFINFFFWARNLSTMLGILILSHKNQSYPQK